MSSRIAIVIAGLVAGLAVARPAAAEPGSAPSRLMEAGLAAYRAGDYDAAIAAFRAAHAADGRPSALFAMAQAERMNGDCAAAVADYDRFLATRPTERQAAAAREMRARCADDAPAAGTAPAPAPAAVAPSVPPPRVVAGPAGPTPWYHDRVTDGLVAGAGVLAAVALGFSLAGDSAAANASAADTYAAHAAAADRASRHRVAGAVSLAGAAVLGGVAAWRIVHHHRAAERAIAVAPGPGVGLALVGSF
jgi:tetratricopeptide (TPR) repeat protein